MYYLNKTQKRTISKLKTKLQNSIDKIKAAYEISKSDMFRSLESNLDPAGISFLKSTLNNCDTKRPTWTEQDKVFSLALYKRGPRCYNLLKQFIPLPSKTTIQSVLKNIPQEPGLNEKLLQKIHKRMINVKPIDRTCCLIFDEIALAEQLVFDKVHDKIIGVVDLGTLGRKIETANHALVFMIHGLRKKWEQPLAYYFTKDVIKTIDLVFLIKEIITSLQSIGLKVLATICDQGSTNRAAIKQLTGDRSISNPGPYFFINSQKIFTIYDPPHLLKST